MSFDPNAAAAKDSGVFGLPDDEGSAKVVLLPVPFDATTSYRDGTHKGPQAILAASRQVDLFDLDTGKPYEAGIAMLPESEELQRWNKQARERACVVIEAGGVVDGDQALTSAAADTNAISARVNAYVYEETTRLLAAGKLVGTIGGDHAVPFGAIQAHAERYPGMGILHLDAHADLRAAYEGFEWSHASIMHNVMTKIPGVGKLVQVGIRDFGEQEHRFIRDNAARVTTFFDAELAAAQFDGESWRHICERIVAALPHEVYLSFDIDGLDPSLCPNTGTPVPGGLSFQQLVALLREVRRSGRRIVGFDLTEVAPHPTDPTDERDASVGARVLYKMIGFALKATA